jgi:hypothetical protein
MRSILAAPAARILHVSRILHDTGTLTHYRGLRDGRGPRAAGSGPRAAGRGQRAAGSGGRGSTDDPSAPRFLEITEAPASRQAGHGR